MVNNDKGKRLFNKLVWIILETLYEASESRDKLGGAPESYIWIPMSQNIPQLNVDLFMEIMRACERAGYWTIKSHYVTLTPKGYDLAKDLKAKIEAQGIRGSASSGHI